MSTKKHKEIRRFKVKIYYFNENTKAIEFTEILGTKPVTKKDFERILKERLEKADQAYCWEILR